MVRLTKIYTRGGDSGKTSLGDGSRVPKHSLRPAAYGTIDEVNTTIGLARIEADVETDSMLARIQNDLFDLGADLCTPEEKSPKYQPLRIAQEQVDRLETEIDSMNLALKPLESFILPGGTVLAAKLHHARAVVRRAEREITKLAGMVNINLLILKYINRLSDHLFVLARLSNNHENCDVLWVPGKNRKQV